MTLDVYITDITAFLPNNPVNNEEIEKILGMVDQVSSRIRKIILQKNKIHQRYYAIDPATGLTTHTNVQLAAEAIRRLKPYEGFSLDDIECLCCGTSSPDQLMPGHGSMVHGELGNIPCEVVSTAGICLSGMTAMKYAYMTVAMGLAKNAVASGSELASSFIRSRFFGPVSQEKVEDLEESSPVTFNADFLRWMLSDGAGAVFLTNTSPSGKPVLKIDWIEHISHANQLETCMYAGAIKDNNGNITGWREFSSLQEALKKGAFLIKQDTRLLNQEVATTAVERTLSGIIQKHALSPSDITWFLPHYSSEYFRPELYDHMKSIDFEIPPERWFTNLAYKGNTGAASIYIILEEFFKSDRIKKGDKILCFIPESGRFSMCYMMLTAV